MSLVFYSRESKLTRTPDADIEKDAQSITIHVGYFKIVFILYVFTFTCMYVCITSCIPSICRGQKLVSDPLKLEHQIVANHHVGAGN